MGRSGISRAFERPDSGSLAGQGSGGTQRDVLLHRGATLRRDGNGEAVGGKTRSCSAATESENPKNGPPREGLSILYTNCISWMLAETKRAARRCYLYERNESLEIT